MAALALIVTHDSAIAAEAYPKTDWHNRSYVPPTETNAGASSTALFAGHPEDWDGLTTFWLATWAGSAETVAKAVDRLVGALQDGRVTCLARTSKRAAYSDLPASAWAGATLIPDWRNLRRLVGARRADEWTIDVATDLVDVLMRRDQVSRLLDLISVELTSTTALATSTHTIAAENRLEKWLIATMQANPDKPRSKAATRAEAVACGFQFSGAGFGRAWASAVKAANAPAWSAAGRKSARLIEQAD